MYTSMKVLLFVSFVMSMFACGEPASIGKSTPTTSSSSTSSGGSTSSSGSSSGGSLSSSSSGSSGTTGSSTSGSTSGSSSGGVDSGIDAGEVDSGIDAGEMDASIDSGVDLDSGTDAGVLDAGDLDAGDAGLQTDAGIDAGDPDAGVLDAGIDAGVDAGIDGGDAFASCLQTWAGLCSSWSTSCLDTAQMANNTCVGNCYAQSNPPTACCLQQCNGTYTTNLEGCSGVQAWCSLDGGVDGGLGTAEKQCAQFLPDAGELFSCGQCLGAWNSALNVSTVTDCRNYLQDSLSSCMSNPPPDDRFCTPLVWEGTSNPPSVCANGDGNSDAGDYCPPVCEVKYVAFTNSGDPMSPCLVLQAPDAGYEVCSSLCSM